MFHFKYLLLTKIVWARCYRLLPYCAYLKSNFLVHWRIFCCGSTLIMGALLIRMGYFTAQRCFQLLWLEKQSVE